MRGCGSGYRSSSRFIPSHVIRARCERRLNHFRHAQTTRCQKLLFTGLPRPVSSTETTGPPRFLEDPTMNVPCSPTPAGPLCSATAALRCCLPPFGRRRLPRLTNISRLNHTARTFAVYASQGGLPHRHARLASGGWPTLPGGTGYPPGPNKRFQVIPSSFTKLCLAHPDNWQSDSFPVSSCAFGLQAGVKEVLNVPLLQQSSRSQSFPYNISGSKG
jgi:hypothetical protein